MPIVGHTLVHTECFSLGVRVSGCLGVWVSGCVGVWGSGGPGRSAQVRLCISDDALSEKGWPADALRQMRSALERVDAWDSLLKEAQKRHMYDFVQNALKTSSSMRSMNDHDKTVI